MDSIHTILSHSFTVICLLPPPPLPNLKLSTPLPQSQNQRRAAYPKGFCNVNNKSCVTWQFTQTAYHLFIVVYHNDYLVYTEAKRSQTQAFVNELERLPDLKINCMLPRSFDLFTHPCISSQRKDRDCSWREQACVKLDCMSVYTGISGTLC